MLLYSRIIFSTKLSLVKQSTYDFIYILMELLTVDYFVVHHASDFEISSHLPLYWLIKSQNLL